MSVRQEVMLKIASEAISYGYQAEMAEIHKQAEGIEKDAIAGLVPLATGLLKGGITKFLGSKVGTKLLPELGPKIMKSTFMKGMGIVGGRTAQNIAWGAGSASAGLAAPRALEVSERPFSRLPGTLAPA